MAKSTDTRKGDQLGFSEYIKSTLGSEEQLLIGDETLFNFAMTIDELEEVLDADDIFALYWIIDHVEEKDVGGYLSDLQEAYFEADQAYEESRTEDIDRHFREGMHYAYCYTKKLPLNDETRKKAVKFFMSDRTRYKLGKLIVAYTIGRAIETMLEEGPATKTETESAG